MVVSEVRQAVEERLGATVEFLQELVRAPSLLGEEESAQEVVERRMREIGFAVRDVVPAENVGEHPQAGIPWIPYAGRRNLVGELQGESDAAVVLNGHVDVVSVGPEEQWSVAPFGGEIRDGRLYGRGAGDMKGGVAAMLLGIEAARALGPLPATVVYQSVIEEESTGNGALAAGLATPAPEAALIAEPSAGNVHVAAIGVIYARITIRGPAGHAMSSDQRSNPIDEAYAAIAAMRELEAAYNGDPDAVFEGVERPYLLNVGSLHAGDWASSTPAKAVVEARMGFPIRLTVEEAQRRLRDAVRGAVPHADVELIGHRAHGYAFDAEAPFVRVLRDCHEQFHGSAPAITADKGTTDLRFFQRPFPAAAGAACYGPEGGNFHGVDEWVDIASIADCATVIALTLRSYRPEPAA